MQVKMMGLGAISFEKAFSSHSQLQNVTLQHHLFFGYCIAKNQNKHGHVVDELLMALMFLF
jgi:hypothetical protein